MLAEGEKTLIKYGSRYAVVGVFKGNLTLMSADLTQAHLQGVDDGRRDIRLLVSNPETADRYIVRTNSNEIPDPYTYPGLFESVVVDAEIPPEEQLNG
jgi:hypothetical protein